MIIICTCGHDIDDHGRYGCMKNISLSPDHNIFCECKESPTQIVRDIVKIAQACADSDVDDSIGDVKVEIPCNGYPMQYIRTAAIKAVVIVKED